ncbi:MAG: class I SAM-dependent methyltransferase [Gloeocapsa sp. DLM2.Bin57]|nr:MAG: class I SAM-dependent methyltransferase [Gloeocapsa sp. DLM2.Bin57]
MGLEILQTQPYLIHLLLPLWCWDARHKFSKLQHFLKPNQQILELGCGLGTVTDYFQQQGLTITPIDIKNLSLFPDIKPIVYDGNNIPFDDKTFDIVLLLTVLHHTIDVIKILDEAQRVSNQIIIIEDIYDHKCQQYLTYGVDSLINFEFREHPHNNRTDEQWHQLFKNLNLKINYTYIYSFVFFFKQVLYVLDC